MKEIKFNDSWNIVDKISHLQRRIIIYSIMYYEMDESCISDSDYNGISQQLVNLMKDCTESDLKKTTYYYCMSDYDGSTGADLRSRLKKKDKEYLTILSSHLMEIHKSKTNT